MSDKPINLSSPTSPGLNPPKVKFPSTPLQPKTQTPPSTTGKTKPDTFTPNKEPASPPQKSEESSLAERFKSLEPFIQSSPQKKEEPKYKTLPYIGTEPIKFKPLPPADINEKPQYKPL